MSKLEELRIKYGLKEAKYEPKPNCSVCHGTGERVCRDGHWRFCICLFVDHEISDFAAKTLSDTAKKLRLELEEQP